MDLLSCVREKEHTHTERCNIYISPLMRMNVPFLKDFLNNIETESL